MLTTKGILVYYEMFCEQGSLPLKPTGCGFVKLITDSFFLPVFWGYVLKQGHTVEQIDEWEREVFNGKSDTFFSEVEGYFKL